MPMAYKMNAGFVPVRKPNKLPAETISESYDLEYGSDTIEIHADAIEKGASVVICEKLPNIKEEPYNNVSFIVFSQLILLATSRPF